MKKTNFIINILFTVISIFLITINIYICYSKIVKKDDVIDLLGYSFLIVVSGSMEPNISVDDMVIIKKQNNYFIDDIITYKSKNSLITHRIVRIEGEKIYTKGDNNNTEDEPIELSKIKGKVICRLKSFGKIFDIIQSPVIIAVVIVISFFVLAKSIFKGGK